MELLRANKNINKNIFHSVFKESKDKYSFILLKPINSQQRNTLKLSHYILSLLVLGIVKNKRQ